MTDSSQLDALDKRIIQLIEEQWRQHESPLLLSLLGDRLGGESMKLAKRDGLSLQSYLDRRLSNRIRLIRKGTVIAATPIDVEGDEGDHFEKLLENIRSRPANAGPRFRPAFWAAFRTPLDKQQKRYVSLQEPFRFLDKSSEEQPPPNHVEIGRQFVADPDGEASFVQRKIEEWLGENDLEEHRFLWSDRRSVTGLPSNDLLGRFLLALESDDLKRVSVPLDIVRKLRQKPL